VGDTAQPVTLVANLGDAMVKSMIENPFLFWKVGIFPLLHTIKPRAWIMFDRASPLLLHEADPQSVWWALKSPVRRTLQFAVSMLQSSLDIKPRKSEKVFFVDLGGQ